MINGQSAKTLARAPVGGRYYLGDRGLSNSPRRLLLRTSITGFNNYRYYNCIRDIGIPDLETQTRLQLVSKEVAYG